MLTPTRDKTDPSVVRGEYSGAAGQWVMRSWPDPNPEVFDPTDALNAVGRR